MDLQAYIDAHPHLAAAVTLVAGWVAPTPQRCRRWLADALVLVKGAAMSLNAQQIRDAVHNVQELVKLGLEYVPGDTPQEKATNLEAEIDPIFKSALEPLNLPGPINDFATKILNWMIEAEVKAAEAA